MVLDTIPAVISHGVEHFSDHAAVVDGEVVLTYADLAERVDEVGRALLASGILPGDRIAIWVPNRHEFVLALLGAESIGAVVVPLNTRYRGHEARLLLERSRAKLLVVADGFLDNDYLRLLESSGEGGDGALIAGLPHLTTIADVAGGGHPAAISWPQLLDRAADVPVDAAQRAARAVRPDTVCDILYTSGTTGVPKGVMSAHRQTVGVAQTWARGAGLDENDRYAVVNPFFHSFGYKAGLIAAMTAGSTIYPVLTFDPVGLMELIQEQRISVLPGAPTIFTTLINHPRRSEFDLSSLRFAIAGAASVPESLFEQMMQVLGFRTVAQAYGLTECVLATQSRPGEDPRHVAETTGPGVPGIEVRVVDADGTQLPVGADGEILLRGDNVMLGYFEDPEATAAAVDDAGWLHTGDIGRLDEHGCLKITDRLKDMFIVGGFNVYPAEIERVLSAHGDVVDCAVIGIEDERLGAVGRAYVLPRTGATPSSAELTDFCRERLANFKVPRDFILVEDLPRTASGKIVKTQLPH